MKKSAIKHVSSAADIRMRVAWLIRAHRITAIMKQEGVAAKMGVTQSTYARWENGQSPITVEQFFILCHIIKLDPVAVVKAVQG